MSYKIILDTLAHLSHCMEFTIRDCILVGLSPLSPKELSPRAMSTVTLSRVEAWDEDPLTVLAQGVRSLRMLVVQDVTLRSHTRQPHTSGGHGARTKAVNISVGEYTTNLFMSHRSETHRASATSELPIPVPSEVSKVNVIKFWIDQTSILQSHINIWKKCLTELSLFCFPRHIHPTSGTC